MAFRIDRFLIIALILTSAAVAVSAEESEAPDEVDRTDFSDPSLSEDIKLTATESHSDIEPAWILPESPDSTKLHIGGTTDLLVAMINNGNKMFNMSHIVVKLRTSDGTLYKDLGRFEYGQPLGPREQRSFRYPLELDAEETLGTYKLEATAYYNDKEKYPFLNVVVNQSFELVPARPNRESQMQMLQMGLGGVGMLLILASVAKLLTGGGGAAKAKEGAAKKAKAPAAVENEWLAGTLAGTENRSPKKDKSKRA
ncbi:hypothetical protein Ctob_001834 [Chrysochromulina tobinii]|jgi:hypothetical protein|uniref:Signal sequence receptor subunit alpha n=1 Tax=Chrysochromulina tobinii TaxID=1460289 RepID=A0A0M0J3N7_9EUKA|nr:hypothetical protein Ctob_001834 [Chrysochromulina tobinii]|eukprot:KOO21140.1 hypothetical protein Ctob_001834 [Chrysochromulina sp. CCMP291]